MAANDFKGGNLVVGKADQYSLAVSQFFNRIAMPVKARRTLYATMIDSLVSTGVWALLDTLYVFAAVDQATALENLVSGAYRGTAVNAPTFTADVGFTGDAVSMAVDTSFNPTVGAKKFTQNDACIFGWDNTNTDQSAGMIGYSNLNANIRCRSRADGNFAETRLNMATNTNVRSGVADGRGLTAASRTTSTNEQGYYNGALSGGANATATSAVISATFRFLHDSSFSSHQVCAGGWGSQLSSTNHADLYSALHTYLQAVAGVA